MTTTKPSQRRKSTSGSETRQRDPKIDVRHSVAEKDLVSLAAAKLGVAPAAFLRHAGQEKAAAVLAS